MKTFLTCLAVLALASVSACHQQSTAPIAADPPSSVAALAGAADSGVFIAGTIAALGSFEWDAAPLTNHAATAIHEAAVAFKQGRISEGNGQKIVDAATQANNFVVKAVGLCKQNSKTGKCTGDEIAARRLLEQARAALSDIP